jgi:hypothetical protein
MFVRFRETPYGLVVSLVETRRENGKVRHEHVASLGSIETPPSVAARVDFWHGLHERLAQLSNRLDAETRGKIMGAVHARVPMVTLRRGPQPDRRRALELLASSPRGCTEALLFGYGFTAEMLADLIKGGLATSHTECIIAGDHAIEVTRAKITEAGQRALAERST